MKKLILVILLIATLIALVGCKSVPVEAETKPVIVVSVQEYEDLIERIGELEQELGNKTSDLQEYITDVWKALNDRYVQMELDELSLIIDNLEEIIFENERRISELEAKLLADEPLNETLHVDSVYFTIEAVIVDGLWTQMTVCEIFDGECETEYPNDEQFELMTNGNRDDVMQELVEYGKFLDSVYEALS